MSRLLIDTSVLIKWFHSEGESEVGPARAIRFAHVNGNLDAHILDLAVYETGNVLLRALGWPGELVAEQLSDMVELIGAPLGMAAEWLGRAASLADAHGLTFYDASWAAAAAELGIPLVSADRLLLGSGLAESATDICKRLRIPLS